MKHNINDNQIESISRILGDALTGSVITKIFESCSVKEKKSFYTYGGKQIELSQSKWVRIYDTFHEMITIECGDEGYFLKFIETSIDPSRFYGNSSNQRKLLDQLNTILLLIGVEARDDGKLHEVEAAKTLTEVQVRINSLTHEIKFRHLHFELFKYCSVEFLNEDYFHACFESVKGVLERIRSLTKLSLDGAKLLDVVFSKDKPLILINDFKTENDKNEFLGLKDLIKDFH